MNIEAIPPSAWLDPSAWRGPQGLDDPFRSIVASPAVNPPAAEFTIPPKTQPASSDTVGQTNTSQRAADIPIRKPDPAEFLNMVARILQAAHPTGSTEDLQVSPDQSGGQPPSVAVFEHAVRAYQQGPVQRPQLDLAA